MIVDIFTHVLPAEFTGTLERMGARFGLVKRLMEVRELHDLDLRFRTMDEMGDYRQIVALPNPPIEAFADPRQCADLARIANDSMAELVRRHPDRFPGFIAALSMNDMDASMKELERAITRLGACGVQVFTNVNGKPLDAPEFQPLFAAMAAHDLPVWLHPARSAETTDYAAEPRSRFEMWWCFGWPYDTSVAMARLVFSGLFDRHPGINIITHHLGGMIPYFDKRIESGLAVLGSRTREEDYSGVLSSLKRPHIEYFKLFHADTALFGASHGLACGLDFFGPGNVVFATDAPFGPIAATRDAIEAGDLDAQSRAAIFHGNAEKLLRRKIV
jgi:predicted TIM-barrel fold metal-dependent hydrolase